MIIPSATHDDPLLQARSPGEPGHKASEKSGLYPKSPKVADDVIEAEFARIIAEIEQEHGISIDRSRFLPGKSARPWRRVVEDTTKTPAVNSGRRLRPLHDRILEKRRNEQTSQERVLKGPLSNKAISEMNLSELIDDLERLIFVAAKSFLAPRFDEYVNRIHDLTGQDINGIYEEIYGEISARRESLTIEDKINIWDL